MIFSPQIVPIIQDTLLTYLPKKVIFSSKCAFISSTILTFLPNNPLCFFTKNTQKVNFSSKCDYNTGHFIDFSPEKGDFSSKYACISSFTTKISKKLIFPQILPNNTGHFILTIHIYWFTILFPMNMSYKKICFHFLFPWNMVHTLYNLNLRDLFFCGSLPRGACPVLAVWGCGRACSEC